MFKPEDVTFEKSASPKIDCLQCGSAAATLESVLVSLGGTSVRIRCCTSRRCKKASAQEAVDTANDFDKSLPAL